jgi:site-specific DNA recombinase
MKPAVIYARVSSKDQEREGYSIPAQLKLLREYAHAHGFEVVREFVDVETAKISGRKQFGAMVRFFRENRSCRTAIVEKTDRLYRNFRDCVTLEDLEIEIHLPKEGQVISKDSKSQAKLVHGIQVVIARNYIENLREEVRKGMREKAEQGIYPSRPPLGYSNNKLEHTIEIDSRKAPLARRMFELYASGRHSLASLRNLLKAEFGQLLAKGYLERLLKNPFYKGQFIWEDKLYNGTHAPLISAELFKLDGKISEEFWTRKSTNWISEEQQILLAIDGLEQANPERVLDAVRTLELANKAYFLYVKQPPIEKAKLLKMVLSNCTVDAASV